MVNANIWFYCVILFDQSKMPIFFLIVAALVNINCIHLRYHSIFCHNPFVFLQKNAMHLSKQSIILCFEKHSLLFVNMFKTKEVITKKMEKHFVLGLLKPKINTKLRKMNNQTWYNLLNSFILKKNYFPLKHFLYRVYIFEGLKSVDSYKNEAYSRLPQVTCDKLYNITR